MKTGRPKARKPARRTSRARAKTVPPILVATDLVKDYVTDGATTRALDGVSLDIEPGSFVAVMGPSGSGKSTLLHLLGGLDAPTSGGVSLDGKMLSGLPDRDVTLARRGSIGFVFQFFNLVPVLTIAENIALPLVIAGVGPSQYRPRLDDVLDQVGLTDVADKLPSQVSGGQHQRTAIARAIFPEPAIVLADEPTGNLDTRTGQQILRLLKSLQTDHGQTILVVTHDPRAAAFGELVVYLEDGKVRSTLDLAKPATRRSGAKSAPRRSGAKSAPRRSGAKSAPRRSGAKSAPRRSGAKSAPRRSGAKAQGGDDARAQAVLAWLQKLGA